MTYALKLFLKRHRKALTVPTSVNNVTEQPDAVSSRQRDGRSPELLVLLLCGCYLGFTTRIVTFLNFCSCCCYCYDAAGVVVFVATAAILSLLTVAAATSTTAYNIHHCLPC